MQPDNSAPRSVKPLNQRIGFWLTVLIIVILISVIFHKQLSQGNKKVERPQIAVVLATVKTANMPVYLNALGAVTPTDSVVVRTQINGTLFKVFFKEGDMVKAGQLLALVDPRPYEAQLTQYEGQLIRDQALLANALIDLKRYQTLWKQNSIAEQILATQVSLVKQYQGAVQIDQGQIAQTKINLIYCNITAPVAGKIGLRLVDPGNYVQTSDTNGVVIINTMNPMTVIFSLPEDDIPEILAKMDDNNTLLVKAYNRDQQILLATGTLSALDNEVDQTTGTVRLRARFNNQNNRLFPNQFVNIHLLINTLNNAMIVPTAAIQFGNGGSYVYLVNADQTVTAKNVKTGVTVGNDTVIAEGLKVGQSVVIEGADNLTDGMSIKARRQTTKDTTTRKDSPIKEDKVTAENNIKKSPSWRRWL